MAVVGLVQVRLLLIMCVDGVSVRVVIVMVVVMEMRCTVLLAHRW